MSDLPGVVRQLPAPVREKYRDLLAKAIVKQSDFDTKALTHLQSLPESSQLQVICHLESNRQQLVVARSKSAFLVSLCERAKRGALDVRGFGVPDVFSAQLASIARNFPETVSLVPEAAWQEAHPPGVVSVVFAPRDVVGEFPMSAKISDLKLWLAGSEEAAKKITLKHPTLSVLKNHKSLAFYNFRPSEVLEVHPKSRGGRRVNKVE